MQGSLEPFFPDLSLQFDPSRQTIVGFDGWGRERWPVSLSQDRQRQVFPYSASAQARLNGHLLLVTVGWKLVAIDMLGSRPNGMPRTLWSQDLVGSERRSAQPPNSPAMGPPLAVAAAVRPPARTSNLLAAVGRQYVCFQRFRNLMAVDPRSGETLWSRQDLPQGCTLFGDDQYVLALPPDREEATVLRAVDGELVGTRKVPRLARRQRLPNDRQTTTFARLEETCLATLGRNLLLWWPEGNRRVLTLVDPLEGRDLWAGRKFSGNAHACLVGDEAVGVIGAQRPFRARVVDRRTHDCRPETRGRAFPNGFHGHQVGQTSIMCRPAFPLPSKTCRTFSPYPAACPSRSIADDSTPSIGKASLRGRRPPKSRTNACW